jgi:hypothetical protein
MLSAIMLDILNSVEQFAEQSSNNIKLFNTVWLDTMSQIDTMIV